MNTIDSLRAALDVAIATEQGDIDIADDILKSSAFLVAIASAAIYFSLSQIEKIQPVTNTNQLTVIAFLTSSAILSASVLLAAGVHRHYMRFRALCRNMLVARRILHSELLERISELESSKKDSPVPLWALVVSGHISEHINVPTLTNFPETQEKQTIARNRLDKFHNWQRRLVILGFVLILVSAITPSVFRITEIHVLNSVERGCLETALVGSLSS